MIEMGLCTASIYSIDAWVDPKLIGNTIDYGRRQLIILAQKLASLADDAQLNGKAQLVVRASAAIIIVWNNIKLGEVIAGQKCEGKLLLLDLLALAT